MKLEGLLFQKEFSTALKNSLTGTPLQQTTLMQH